MCGRFNLRLTPAELQRFFDLLQIPAFLPRFNIAPTQQILTISATPDGRVAIFRRWGLVPSWTKEPGKGPSLINARGDTVFKLPSFRSAVRKSRCLIPMSGFYEWTAEGKQRQPWHIQDKSGDPLAVAGICEHWERAGKATIDSCTIVTTDANAEMATLHDRMPVILPQKNWEKWLDPGVSDPEQLAPLLMPLPDGSLVMERVNPLVNNARNETPGCIRPLESGMPNRGELF